MIETQLLSGTAVAATVKEEVAERVSVLNGRGKSVGLATVLVGEDPASEVYVRNKGRQTTAAGMNSIEHRLPATTSEEDLLAVVRSLNGDDYP